MRVRVWFDAAGAEQGKPWAVQYGEGEPKLCSRVELEGSVTFAWEPTGSPRGFAQAELGPMPAARLVAR